MLACLFVLIFSTYSCLYLLLFSFSKALKWNQANFTLAILIMSWESFGELRFVWALASLSRWKIIRIDVFDFKKSYLCSQHIMMTFYCLFEIYCFIVQVDGFFFLFELSAVILGILAPVCIFLNLIILRRCYTVSQWVRLDFNLCFFLVWLQWNFFTNLSLFDKSGNFGTWLIERKKHRLVFYVELIELKASLTIGIVVFVCLSLFIGSIMTTQESQDIQGLSSFWMVHLSFFFFNRKGWFIVEKKWKHKRKRPCETPLKKDFLTT